MFGVSSTRLSLPTSGVTSYPARDSVALETGDSFGAPSGVSLPYFPAPIEKVANVPQDQRLVIQNSNLSLLVEDVQKVGNEVVSYAKQAGGFIVGSSYNQPEESPFGTITVRVPTDKLDATLQYFRSLAIKVTNENLVGNDVTDSYVDIQARLESLEKVKAKFEAILDSAVEVQDILTVQREIINTQTQIDNLKGQAEALEQNANLTKITVYLSTDELSLPYTPDEKFRPGVIFKLAVRSMLGTLQGLGELFIWILVYAVLWVPALIFFIVIRKYLIRRKQVK